ncbi:MAG TPA: zf-HC2 domain-containing protein [Thermoanaerobaculia bacterium]
MEHKDAIGTKAAERYLLGEMTEDERAVFEEHYFDCRVCAADVTDGTRLLVVGQVVASESAQPSNVVPIRPSRFGWIPAAAAASVIFGLLGTGAGYRIAQERYGPATELVRSVRIDTGVSRAGGPAEVPVVRAGDELRFDVEPRDEAAGYAASVVCGEKVQSRQSISREMAADAISLRLGELPAGRCELVIEGVRKDGNRFPITTSPFQVGER